jgi:hypothetical protein
MKDYEAGAQYCGGELYFSVFLLDGQTYINSFNSARSRFINRALAE